MFDQLTVLLSDKIYSYHKNQAATLLLPEAYREVGAVLLHYSDHHQSLRGTTLALQALFHYGEWTEAQSFA